MNNTLFSDSYRNDFTVDRSTNSVFVNREFDAELSLVWDAFTKKEILDQWWAPKPWMSKTKSMDFKVGGRRFYAMVSPEGQEHYSIQDFTSITPKTNFKFVDGFVDKDQNINNAFPSSNWDLNFTEHNGPDGYRGTTVAITIKHKTLESLEQIVAMGFEGGFTMTLNELTRLLQTLKK
jgi:uncharacterized protein YndB with AHSA1/START domain